MHISWLGTTAIRLQTKNLDTDVNVIIDPYKPAVGEFPRSLTAQLVLYTRGEKDTITISGNPFLLSTPGECDIKEVLVHSTEGHREDEIMLRIDSEQISLGILGLTNKQLNDKQRELLSGVDVLFVPVGHKDAYDTESAVKLISDLEPRIVIPIAFQSDNDPDAGEVSRFIKAMGISNGKEPEKKVIIKKKDLPQEETQVIVLGKE